MKLKKLLVLAVVSIAMAAQSAQADVITPSYTSFGSLPAATFGGSGIPNDAVAKSEFQIPGHNVVLGLTAHQRFSNPPLANNGAGIFTAVNGGDSGNGQPGYGRWNLGFYHNFEPDLLDVLALSDGYLLRLYYDLNPAVGNNVTTYVPVDPIFINGLTMDSENSLNLGMTSIFGPGFDPNATGEYGLSLALYKNGVAVGTAASILVNVTDPNSTAVPEIGSTMTLLGLAFAGTVAFRRKK